MSLANIYVESYHIFFNKDLGISPSRTLYGPYYIWQPFPDIIFQRWKTCNEELTSREKQDELLETSMLLHKDKQTSDRVHI